MTLIQSSSIGKTTNTRTVGRHHQSFVLILSITLLIFGGIGCRLAYLQLIEGTRSQQLADNNRIRLLPKQPERGTIFDRKGKILASSRLARAVYVWPRAPQKAEWVATRSRLSQLLNIPEAEIQKRVQQAGYNSPTLVRIARDLNPAQMTALAEYKNELIDVEVYIEAVREYPNGELASHVLGYTGEMSDRELAKKRDQGYRLGDVIGQMGVESAFEKQLRGEWGGQQVEVDGAGRIVRILGEKNAKSGQNVHLTLDLDVQKAAEKALGTRQGAIVALDPRNGAGFSLSKSSSF
jgi:penicillin-binding protein 2